MFDFYKYLKCLKDGFDILPGGSPHVQNDREALFPNIVTETRKRTGVRCREISTLGKHCHYHTTPQHTGETRTNIVTET